MVSASFALHHVPTDRRKGALYKRCFASLRTRRHVRQRRLLPRIEREGAASAIAKPGCDHLQRSYPRAKAENFLKTWAKEDVYFTLEREIELLKDAGFAVDVTLRRDSFAVLVGLK